MNLSLKNPFAAKATPPTDDPTETGSPLDDAERTVKRWQLERGRTKARVEALQTEVDTARADEKHATQTEGVAIYEGQNSTALANAAQQAGHRLAALEAALAIAIQKDDAAQAELQQAEHQVVVSVDDEANEELKDATRELEAILVGLLNPSVDRVAKARLVVKNRSGADSATGSALRDFDLWFKVYLHRSCAALIPGSDGYSVPIDKEGKLLRDWADAVIYNMKRRRRS